MKVIPETHVTGKLSIETIPNKIKCLNSCDFGIQIAEDGRIWICIDGVAFIRFKPAKESNGH